MAFSDLYRQISSLSNLPAPDSAGIVSHCVFQYIDFNKTPQYVSAHHLFSDCYFFGCEIPPEMDGIGASCLVFPRLGMNYNVFRRTLYSGESLYEGYDPENEETFNSCFDTRVYSEYISKGIRGENIRDTLGRTLHDYAIHEAMDLFLSRFDERQVVAVMGGHALLRNEQAFRNIVMISKSLTERGKVMASGGGPGAMEATHLGAWMAGRTTEEVDDALAILSEAPSFKDPGWLRTAFQVRAKYPQEIFQSLGIPTWFYGHEPATPFATHIAKYFINSVREDILLTVAKGGIIYSPGSAGTIQEIFQDAAQNHYSSVGAPSPMIFLGKEYYTKEIPVYPLLEDLLARGKYKGLILSITDSPEEAVESILSYADKDKN